MKVEMEKRDSKKDTNQHFFHASAADFKKIPGSPIAYWVSDAVRWVFSKAGEFSVYAPVKQGLATADNDLFLRFWPEISVENCGRGFRSRAEAAESRLKWFPYNKGGEFRKWFGNNEYLVNWERDGQEIRTFGTAGGGRARSRAQNTDFYFRSSVTWSFVSSSYFGVRYSDPGAIFDVGGSSAFPSETDRFWVTGFLCSKQVFGFMKIMNPTLNFQVGNVAALPILFQEISARRLRIEQVVEQLIQFARSDWDAYERSWDFQSNPLVQIASEQQDPEPGENAASRDLSTVHSSLSTAYTLWVAQNRKTIAEMQCLEEENNRLFIDAYGLADELTPDVPIEQITLTVNPAYRYGKKMDSEQWSVDSGFGEELETRFREDTMKELVSYAIGCMMGRYRLDRPGLIYAHSGNERFWEIYEGVDSGPWTVDSQQPSGSHRVAEGDGTGGEGVSNDQGLPARGAVWTEQPDSTGRSVDPLQHRGGTGTSIHSGIQEFSFNSNGLPGRSGNTNDDSRETGLRDTTAGQGDFSSAGRNLQDAPQPPQKAEVENLSTVHYPLSTQFHPDDDGIIPLTDYPWFEDDAANRMVEFISVAWDAAHLEENLTFLADNLGPKKNESSRETIRRYLCDKFFKDHLKTYKKRPIYWLFSSGKQKAFQCLVYLHRYNEGTLSRMRTEYVIPLQGMIASRIEYLDGDIPAASSTAHRRRLEKERDTLVKQRAELQEFDEKLRHYADQRITLDLDDGVKVNYSKFGDLLAEVKAVTGRKG